MPIMMTIKKFGIYCATAALFLGMPVLSLYAQDDDNSTTTKQKVKWVLHSSPSGSFDVRFPREHKYKLYPFRISDNVVVYSGEILASHDEKPYKDSVKSYFIKFDQTLGPALTLKETARLLEQETRKYILGAEASGGAVLSNDVMDFKGYVGRDISISYPKKDDKQEGMRVRIVYTNIARIQQVFSTSDGGMFAYRTNDFFDSLRLSDGFAITKGELADGWREFPSPHNMFTMRLPQKHPEYTPDDPKFKTMNGYDSAYMIIQDPVVKKLTYYNIHAYKLGEQPDNHWANNFLFTEFVKKFVPKAARSSLEVDEKIEQDEFGNKFGVLQTKLVFTPHKSTPYIDSALLKLHYSKDFVVVQEVIGGHGHVFSDFGLTLIESMLFHPQNYTEKIRDDIDNPKPRKMARKEVEENDPTAENDFPYLEEPPQTDDSDF